MLGRVAVELGTATNAVHSVGAALLVPEPPVEVGHGDIIRPRAEAIGRNAAEGSRNVLDDAVFHYVEVSSGTGCTIAAAFRFELGPPHDAQCRGVFGGDRRIRSEDPQGSSLSGIELGNRRGRLLRWETR